jgi:hypothetical protein
MLSIWHAFEAARDSDPATAYSALIRRGDAQIPHFGPAFFSKFLYFASGNTTPRCLILDARVARSLWALGWSIAPTYRGRSFNYNWYTDTYVAYCSLLGSWAAASAPPSHLTCSSELCSMGRDPLLSHPPDARSGLQLQRWPTDAFGDETPASFRRERPEDGRRAAVSAISGAGQSRTGEARACRL